MKVYPVTLLHLSQLYMETTFKFMIGYVQIILTRKPRDSFLPHTYDNVNIHVHFLAMQEKFGI